MSVFRTALIFVRCVVSVAFRSVGRLVDDARRDTENESTSDDRPHGGSTVPGRDLLQQLQQGRSDDRRARAGHLHLPVNDTPGYTCSVCVWHLHLRVLCRAHIHWVKVKPVYTQYTSVTE